MQEMVSSSGGEKKQNMTLDPRQITKGITLNLVSAFLYILPYQSP